MFPGGPGMDPAAACAFTGYAHARAHTHARARGKSPAGRGDVKVKNELIGSGQGEEKFPPLLSLALSG